MCVRYFDTDENKVCSKFWSLRQLVNSGENHGATAQRIYDSVLESFGEMGVPYDNIIGFASDGQKLHLESAGYFF